MCKPILACVGILVVSALSAQRILPVGAGADLQGITAMAEYNGELVLGGMFASFNDHARRNIQGWDGGTGHNDLAGAFDGIPERVSALALFEDDLIAAGRETSFNNIARWDGSTWSAMGSGLSQRVSALCMHNGELYAGGLDSAVSRWSGTDWEQVGGRFNGPVLALSSFSGYLHAGGGFTQNSEDEFLDQRALSYFNGESWQEAGTGLNGPVHALLSAGDELYVGGEFTADADGNGTFPKWTRLSVGAFSSETHAQLADGAVEGIAQLPDGRVILGGTMASLLLQGNNARVLRLDGIHAAGVIGGRTIVAGDGGTQSYALVISIGELAEGRDYDELAINNIRAGATPTPALFSDPVSNAPSFEADSISGRHTIYSASPWITAYSNGELHSATPKYNEDVSEGDWSWAGPLMADERDADFFRRYYQVWRVRKSEIDFHIAFWDQVGYEMPYSIASWPGNGDVDNGEPALLAPFADLDEDGLYEPEQGEFPLIRQDEAIWYLMRMKSDPDGQHPAMAVEIQVMHYGSSNDSDPDVFNTVYTNYQIINRINITWDSVRFGEFTDFEIGCGADDRVGCDSTLNLYYAYNSDGSDEDCNGFLGFGAQPRAQGTMYLNQALTAHRYILENLVPLEDLMNGTQGGQPFTEPGYPTHFQYPGGSWSDDAAPGDRRSIGTIGPFTLGPGDTLCVDAAHTMGTTNDISVLQSMMAGVRQAYDGWNSPCFADFSTGVEKPRMGEVVFEVFPNPASGQVTVRIMADVTNATLRVLDPSGRALRTMRVSSGTTALSLEAEPAGVYFIQLTDEQQHRWMSSLVVIH